LESGDWRSTFIGWLTVVLYFVACISCWRSGQEVARRHGYDPKERRAWRFISILFLFLGFNKQLDFKQLLQSLPGSWRITKDGMRNDSLFKYSS
jgi:hypothetical protein